MSATSNKRIQKIKAKLRERNAKRGASPLELWVREWLPVANLYGYELEYQVGFYFIDIAWPELKIGIELDGYEFHKNKVEQDKKRDETLKQLGWKIIRISSRELWNPQRLSIQLTKIKMLIDPGRPVSWRMAEVMRAESRLHKMLRRESEAAYKPYVCKGCAIPIPKDGYCKECR